MVVLQRYKCHIKIKTVAEYSCNQIYKTLFEGAGGSMTCSYDEGCVTVHRLKFVGLVLVTNGSSTWEEDT